MEKGHKFYDVSYIMMLLLRFIEAQTTTDYFCQAHFDKPDYTQHDLYRDGIRIHDSSSITFQVMCEGDAFVLLHEHRENLTSCSVEIRIGVVNNSHYGVMINDKDAKLYINCPARDIVSKSEFRYFWISWADHVIHIGHGSIPEIQKFQCKEKITFEINYISIGTASNTGAHWKFEKTQLKRSSTGMIQNLSTPQSIRPSNVSPSSTPSSTSVTQTLLTSQNAKHMNATPQSTRSSTGVTQILSTSQNIRHSNDHSQSTHSPTGMTQTLSTSQNTKPSNEEDKYISKDTVYIIVPVVILSVLISTITGLILKKKGNRNRKQSGLDLVYNGNSSQTTNSSDIRSIEETEMFNIQALESHHNAQATTETQEAHNTHNIMEGKQTSGATSNHFESIQVDKRVKTDDKYTKSHPMSRAETYNGVYSHLSLNNCQNKSMLDTEETYQIDRDTTNASGRKDAFNNGEEDQSSVYDHAFTRNIGIKRGDASDYSQMKDI